MYDNPQWWIDSSYVVHPEMRYIHHNWNSCNVLSSCKQRLKKKHNRNCAGWHQQCNRINSVDSSFPSGTRIICTIFYGPKWWSLIKFWYNSASLITWWIVDCHVVFIIRWNLSITHHIKMTFSIEIAWLVMLDSWNDFSIGCTRNIFAINSKLKPD